MQHRKTQHYVNGAWVDAQSDEVFDVIDAHTEEVFGSVPAGTVEEVDRAVHAARAAFEQWAATPPDQRAKYLNAIAEGLAERSDEIAELISHELGSPRELSESVQAGLCPTSFRVAADIVGDFAFESELGSSTIVREPVGVVGAITPWNYPLHQICCKVAPALAAGCTVVVKPSEVAPLSSYILAEVMDAVGLPPGVFNLVQGAGPVVGEAIASHPEVDMVSFTGSTRAGRRVAELAAQTIKKVALELGGKSANIILRDADLEVAVTAGVGACYANSGQTCSALTRMLVPRESLAEAEEIARRAAESYRIGDPAAAGTKLGPLISETQRDRVRGYIEQGVAEGAKLVIGGPEQPEALPTGYYVHPTVFSEVTPDMTIAREEIFGPVLSIIAYDDEDEAVRIANDSVYGLGGGVWSGDPEHARAVAKRMRTGQVAINGGEFNPLAPFGGYKQSGLGREWGPFGFEEYLEVKALT
ncbi:aldehyde dehydrogenase family protein [Nocardioides marmotae]|uniref:aldehyde dehydrogenase family protein n=1 Tax=Nocardioides marmotae TaxID=2663857 RepID=UPI0012B56272|nr:aldehyde dehydrogenase family protein [Nocardioides marmotae]MBC9732348.1 aldehyde dehydrogenase family protein [Nocardioides marmotae]MTB83468.1 aldehyde dehydrogenase family protein [Nocardioides marmotae]